MATTNDGRPVDGGPARPVYITNAASDPAQVSGGGGGGSATAANQATQIAAEQAILAKLLAAPATEAKQDTGNTSLASIDTKTPAKGAALAANSTPVTLANDGVFAVNHGLATDSAASTDTGTFSLISLFKRFLQKVTAGIGIVPINTTPTFTPINANNTDGVAAMDVSGYRSGTLQLTGTWSATVNIQFSFDSGFTTWVTAFAVPIGGGPLQSLTTNNIYVFAIPPGAGQMRIRTVAFSSGPVVGNVSLSSVALPQAQPVILYSTAGVASTIGTTAADNVVSSASLVGTYNEPLLYDATADRWNRLRNNNAAVVSSSSAKTSTQSFDITNYNARALSVILNITVAPNTASTLTINVRVKDSISGNYITVLTSAVITGSVVTGAVPVTNKYVVALGVTVAANVAVSDALARTMNVQVVHSNGDSWTYSLSAELAV